MSTPWQQPNAVPQMAAVQQPYPYPYAYAPKPNMGPQVAMAVMGLAGIVGFIGACVPYFKYVYEDSYSAANNYTISATGWLAPYSAIAALWIIGAVGVVILDSGLLPQPKGAADAPYKKYTLMASFGGALVLAFASSRLKPTLTSSQFGPDNPNPLDAIHLGPGFWMLIVAAAVGFVAAVASYIMWVNKDNPRPVAPAPAPQMMSPQMMAPAAPSPMPTTPTWGSQPTPSMP